MQLSYPRSFPSDSAGISFPLLECWNAMTKVATVAADVDKKRVLCRVSLEVLIEKYDASEDAPMQTISRQRHEIQAAARRLIEHGVFEEDGSILIRACDL
ncbi:MAG: DUF1488 domain-containing protein [Sedimenticola sp.]|nr:DUF1488 domain-containing protein [Sedimenticola sp.]